MSKSSLRANISEVLLENFKRKSEKSVGEAARILLQSKAVQQCLVLKRKETAAIQRGFEAAIDQTLTGKQGIQYRRELKRYFKGQAEPFPTKAPGAYYFLDLCKRQKLTFGRGIFYLPFSFETIRDKIHTFNKGWMKKNLDKDSTEYESKGSMHLDHGADGTASGLIGAVTGTLGAAKRAGIKIDEAEFAANLRHVLSTSVGDTLKGKRIVAPIMRLLNDMKQHVSKKGSIEAGLAMILTPRDAEGNLYSSTEEAAIQEAFLQAAEITMQDVDFVNMEGSSTLKEKIETVLVLNITGKTLSKQKNVKVTTQKHKLKTSTKDRSESKKGKGSALAMAAAKGRASRPPSKKSKGAGKSSVSMFSYMAMINKRLPQTVRENMGAPALENRSGKFASSVRIRDVNTTPQGHPSFGYTYAKNPYQVFEVGTGSAPWATPQRDPRKLIDKSIREVAAELAIGRFYTRRL
jgi:hypothetical protein